MTLPLVSIVIPNYNYQEWVLNAIESCLAQDYKGPIEVIVVDDASTDSSVLVINHHFRGTIKLIMQGQNRGYSHAKNEGIRHSNGDLIVTLDADDMLTHDSISSRVKVFLDHSETLMVHALAWVIKGDGDFDYWNKRLYKISYGVKGAKIHAQTVMVRREVYRDYGLYEEKLRSRSDNEMWHRLIDAAKIGDRIRFLEHPVAFYRKHDRSMVQFRKKNQEYNGEQTRILEEQKALRLREGITRENTRFLKK